MLRQFWTNLVREWMREWRNLYQLAGLLAFLFGVSYLIYFFSAEKTAASWTLLYWMVYLFVSFFTAARTYEVDNEQYRVYQHQLQNPLWLFASKSCFLFLALCLLGLLIKMVFDLFMPLAYNPFMASCAVIAAISFGMALLMAFSSFLASHGANKSFLLIVLSLPLCFPMLGIAFQLMSQLLSGESLSTLSKLFVPLLAIDLMVVGLIVLLLPLSWKS